MSANHQNIIEWLWLYLDEITLPPDEINMVEERVRKIPDPLAGEILENMFELQVTNPFGAEMVWQFIASYIDYYDDLDLSKRKN